MKRPSTVFAILWLLAWATGLWAASGPDGLATPVISEFMAGNASRTPLGVGDILDGDGDSSDWIELYNPTAESFDLGGWHLTDDSGALAKWQFPTPTILGPDDYLLVFASGKDRTKGQLHTNFKLDAEGGYLALVLSDGRSVACEYAPAYPPQLTNVSYGMVQYRAQFVVPQSQASYHVPNALDEGRNWTAVDFDDSAWYVAAASLSLAPAVGADGNRPRDTRRGGAPGAARRQPDSAWGRLAELG